MDADYIHTLLEQRSGTFCQILFIKSVFGVMNSSDDDKRLCTDHPHENMFPRTAVGKNHDLSIKDTKHGLKIAEVKTRSRYKAPPSHNSFERSSRSDDKSTPRIEQNSIKKHLPTTFAKQDFRNAMLNCFQTQENTSSSIKRVYKQVYKRHLSTIWKSSYSNIHWRS